ncbi:MAG: hypothetical protein R3195_20580, partial [Gemmatimonadota bacterium]|nr:hypothetical protein [Gemmatimonadota bacterium]
MASTEWLKAETPAFASFVHAHRLEDHRFAAYEPALAGVAAGIQSLLPLVRMGLPIERWFARDVPISSRLEGAFFRLTSNQIADAGTRFGPGFARPETV